MRKALCIIACVVAALTSLFALAACTETGTDGRTYYSVAVDGGTGSGKYYEGSVCQVEATVPEGKQFMKWIKNGQEVSVNATYAFEVVENSRLVAVFGDGVADADKEVCLISAPEGIGSGGYFAGSECTLKLPEGEMDRDFKGWAVVEDGVVTDDILSAEKTYTFTVSESLTLKPVYNDVRLATPDNSENKMFNLIAGNGVIEYDRQTDENGVVYSAFTTGVAYIKIYVYIAPGDDAQPIGFLKMIQREDGSAYFESEDGAYTWDLTGGPGNYYTPDGNTHNWLKERISAMDNGPYSTEIAYYFATQAVGGTVVDGVKYIDSFISGKGRAVINM